MKACISEVIEMQSDIIQRQEKIIDRLAIVVLQHSMIDDEELRMMKQVADLQKGLEE